MSSDPRTATPKTHGTPRRVAVSRTALRHAPDSLALQDSELLFGETFTVYEHETEEGWSYGQTRIDSYVGYVQPEALADAIETDCKVTALSTPLLHAPDFKSAVRAMLPMEAQVKVLSRAKGFARVAPDGYVSEAHLAARDHAVADWVKTAERFVGTPYVWGGRSHAGLDCSGLVQIALASGNIHVPRDTDQQQAALGDDVPFLKRKRGDLVFWNGHVGIMLDETRLIHANAYHMQVEIEPLEDAIARITPTAGPVDAVKRL